jgi:hypothetical protein
MKESFDEMSSIDSVLRSVIDLMDFSNWLKGKARSINAED